MMNSKIIAAWVVFIFIFIPFTDAVAFERYNRVKKFDPHFSKYSKRFFGPGFDWKYFKAQSVAESRLIADAKSGVGAEGIMQIMPRTFEEIKTKNPKIKGDLTQPRWNIAAGVWYDRSIWKIWKAKRPFKDKLDFMFGSYNAGKGSILRAQKIAEARGLDPNAWKSIELTLPEVTKKRSKETIEYIHKIHHIKEALK